MRILTITISILLLGSQVLFAQVLDFTFGDYVISPGEKRELLLPAVSGQDSTVIPISVFHGIKPGPVLGITAGVHGLEYAPILAAQRISKQLDPRRMSGTVILVHLANVPSFLQRRFRVNPMDGKNLNRVFPGSPEGTITEVIAWKISNEIIDRCDYFLDMHAGDANNDLRPYAGYYNYFNIPEVSAKAKEMALSLGFDFVVQFGNEERLDEEAVYCSREATKRHIPAVDIECGRMGIVEESFVRQIENAILRLMRHLEILDGKRELVENPVIIGQRSSVKSEHTGFFYSDLSSGEYVKKGMKLGYITDLFGNHLSNVHCPIDGVILYKTFNPPINEGDGLFSIGHIE